MITVVIDFPEYCSERRMGRQTVGTVGSKQSRQEKRLWGYGRSLGRMWSRIQELKEQGEKCKQIENKLDGISEATSSSHSSLNELEKSACRRFME